MEKKFEYKFKLEYEESIRSSQSTKIRAGNFGKIPIVLECATRDYSIIELKQNKFLFPEDFTFFDFSQVIRKKLKLSQDQGVYFYFTTQKLYKSNKPLKQIYSECKDPDGFLYCHYAFENLYGTES